MFCAMDSADAVALGGLFSPPAGAESESALWAHHLAGGTGRPEAVEEETVVSTGRRHNVRDG